MKKILLTGVALIALSTVASAQHSSHVTHGWGTPPPPTSYYIAPQPAQIIVQPPVVIQAPPVVIQQAPIVVQPAPVIVAPPPPLCVAVARHLGEWINIYDQPQGRPVGPNVPPGTPLQIFGTYGVWTQVQAANGQAGFILSFQIQCH